MLLLAIVMHVFTGICDPNTSLRPSELQLAPMALDSMANVTIFCRVAHKCVNEGWVTCVYTYMHIITSAQK